MRRHRLVATSIAVALVAGLAATAAAQSRYVGIAGYAERPVAGAPEISYVVRSFYIAPGSWKAAKAKRQATTRRFGPVGSCRIKITVTARAVADADEPAAARVARLLPATSRYVHDAGLRGSAAWRVIRQPAAGTITGILTRPAPSVRTQPQAGRVWLALEAVGRVDPKVECHSGGPRTVAARIGDMLAAGGLGGFQPR